MELEKVIKQKAFKSPKHKLTINVIFTGNWMTQKTMFVVKPFGLTPQQYNVLRILRGQGQNPIASIEIMDRMLDKSSNVSRLIDKLETKKLVIRTGCEEDRRRTNIVITNEGLEILEKIDKIFPKNETFLDNLTDREAEQLNFLLDKLRGGEEQNKL
jgi:DNA-binding MarR family transcriptional regulator